MKRIDLLGVPIDVVTANEACHLALKHIVTPTTNDGAYHIVTVNPELIMKAQRDDQVMAMIRSSDLVVADGVGVVWAAKRLERPLPERVPGVDLAEAIIRELSLRRGRFFLLGGEKGVADQAAETLERRYPGLKAAGVHHGFFEPNEEDKLVEHIALHHVDVLLVGLGAPKQELFIAKYRHRLNARVLIGVGGALDVYAGRVQRAPKLWQQVGLEWAFRLLSDPKRIRRMAVLPRFVGVVLRTQSTSKKG